jgi:hypothetical protein
MNLNRGAAATNQHGCPPLKAQAAANAIQAPAFLTTVSSAAGVTATGVTAPMFAPVVSIVATGASSAPTLTWVRAAGQSQ